MYSRSPSSLQHADATGSGSCPVVARRLVGPANTLRANLTMILSSSRQSSRDFRAISIIVWARGPGILWWLAQWPTSSITENSSSGNPILTRCVIISVSQKSGGKLTRLTTRVVPAVTARSWHCVSSPARSVRITWRVCMLLGLSQPGPQQRRRSRDFSGHRSACRSQWFGAQTPRN